ncbi:uncharacterized protein LOC112503897 [Cynara cardunculus var. scolymus]|uniref:uncharacterized protein LOC112503897 n=1 Tax=Cynara cardunculus var. scolymus TaxID=59895 RepID=UPI000D626B8E|nr:uncharacterized protein LOC112503897 [Cynara cardunculus var. scolymus]
MHQRQWLKLLKDYDVRIQYHPGKANVVADALSHKSIGNVSSLTVQSHIASDLGRMGISLCYRGGNELLANLTIEPTLVSRIKEAQQEDEELWAILQKAKDDSQSDFQVDDKVIIWFSNRLCVPENPKLKEAAMSEAHNSLFSIHPGSTKMY